jgi:hypothetical protein
MRKPMTKLRLTAALALVAGIAAAAVTPARAWDANGHRVVARIAWEDLRPETRAWLAAALAAAPPDADLASLLAADGRPLAVRQRELFELASTWPDIVRDAKRPERQAKYHHPPWHYTSWFWERPDPQAAPRERLDLAINPENPMERLHYFQATLADPGRAAAQKAVDLAWVLHLVGDIHMPLHCASRVTQTEPRGDQGANLFQLDPEHKNLHAFWDSILTLALPRQAGEDEDAYIGRLASLIAAGHPKAAVAARLDLGHYEAWANEGYDTAKTRVYLADLERGKAPSPAYQRHALEIAEPAIALAGYRLAATLELLAAANSPKPGGT